jgi:hypothetical protein
VKEIQIFTIEQKLITESIFIDNGDNEILNTVTCINDYRQGLDRQLDLLNSYSR